MDINLTNAINNEFDPCILVKNYEYDQLEPHINISYRHFNKLNNNIKYLLVPYLNSECDINNHQSSKVIKEIIEDLINSYDIDELVNFIQWCKTKEKSDIYNYYNYYTIIRIIINNNEYMFRNMIILNDYHINECLIELCQNKMNIIFDRGDKYKIYEELIKFFINKQDYTFTQMILNIGFELAIKYNCNNSVNIFNKYKKQIEDLHIIPIIEFLSE